MYQQPWNSVSGRDHQLHINAKSRSVSYEGHARTEKFKLLFKQIVWLLQLCDYPYHANSKNVMVVVRS